MEKIMILKTDKMERLLNGLGWRVSDFANAMDIDMKEAYSILSGEPMDYYSAKRFINLLTAEFAQSYIDWEAMALENIFRNESRRKLKESIMITLIAGKIHERNKEKKQQ